VFCDDLSMGGAAFIAGHPERAAMALEAGCDMLPKCNNRPAVIELLDRLRVAPDAVSAARLERLRAEPGRTLAELQSLPAWKHARDAVVSIA
jgi:beta-N-acetylhexosaminidase